MKWNVNVCETRMILAIGTRKQDSQFTGFHITDSHSVPTPKAVGGFNRFNPSEHPSDQGTMARCPSRLYKRMFLSSRLRCVMSCVSHVSEGKDSVTSSNFFCSEPWREREGGRRDTRYISTASAKRTSQFRSFLGPGCGISDVPTDSLHRREPRARRACVPFDLQSSQKSG